MTVPGTQAPSLSDAQIANVANRTIADLVEQAPQTMTILAPLGLDLCCGGGHPLGEALRLHGIDADPVLRQVAFIVAESQNG